MAQTGEVVDVAGRGETAVDDAVAGFGLEALAHGGPGAGMALILRPNQSRSGRVGGAIPLLLEPMAEQP